MSQLLNKKSAKRQDQSAIVEEEQILPGETFSHKELLDMALFSKESSIKVQSYLKSLSRDELNLAAS